MTLNILELWDFGNPEESEKRFQKLLEIATPDDALILKTQIARTYGLRGDFVKANLFLAEVEPKLKNANEEAKVRYHLELGRSLSSATHSEESQTSEVKERARYEYMKAFEIAKGARLDYLAIDALHMMSFIDTEPKDQFNWDKQAFDYMQASSQEEAKKWEASLHNNMGYALHLLGRYDEALSEFKEALNLRRKNGKPGQIRIAKWMVAWTLRSLGELAEALQMQLELEKECDEAEEPDPYVYEELEHLYKALNNPEKARHYADLQKIA